jgi:Kef-type K+ transport system membrane component KefB
VSMLLFWLLVLLMFAAATWLGQRAGLASIISQLLLAAIGLPLLMLLWVEPHWQLSAAELLQPTSLQLAYGLSFALLLGYILADVVDLQVSPGSLKIALPSFFVPFFCGLGCGLWLLQLAWLSAVAVGLLFAITAIPVLFLYLRNIGYPLDATRRLLQAAILMDLLCWGLFALAQGSSDWRNLLWPLLAAALPLLLRLLQLRHPLYYSLPFFALMVLMHALHLNALIFGILYLLCLASLRQSFRLPLPAALWQALQNYLAIPLILAVGVLQVDFRLAWQDYSWLYLGALVLLPVASKLAGSWIGLHWADRHAANTVKWRESVLLNIRGLTEIVFLNLLLQQQLIDARVYFSLMLMSLVSTLLPVVLRLRGTTQPSNVEVSTLHGNPKP